MKRTIIVHCWDGTPEHCWYPWLKDVLEGKGITVEVPAMPQTDAPKQSLWVPYLQRVVGEPDPGLILVGHSVGCITILRYLEILAPGQRVGGVVLIAGFTDSLGFEELKNYFETSLDWDAIRSHCDQFIAIHSDNDPFVPLKHGQVFEEALDATLIVKHDMGHFSGPVDNEEGCRRLPDALEAVETLYDHLGLMSEG